MKLLHSSVVLLLCAPIKWIGADPEAQSDGHCSDPSNERDVISTPLTTSSVSWWGKYGFCFNPKKAVLTLLECVGNLDAACAAESYNPEFKRFHNEQFTGDIAVKDPTFWGGAFTFFPSFDIDIKFAENIGWFGTNMASVRYIEKVTSTDGTNLGSPTSSTTFPYSQEVVQHEHAIVTVDNACKILKWSQYGDNKEQTDVDIISGALLCTIDPSNPMCNL